MHERGRQICWRQHTLKGLREDRVLAQLAAPAESDGMYRSADIEAILRNGEAIIVDSDGVKLTETSAHPRAYLAR